MSTYFAPISDKIPELLTQSQYDSLSAKDPNKKYLIQAVGDEGLIGPAPFLLAAYEGATRLWADDRILPGGRWVTRTSAAENSWNSVCWSPELSLFVAVAANGPGNRVMTST